MKTRHIIRSWLQAAALLFPCTGVWAGGNLWQSHADIRDAARSRMIEQARRLTGARVEVRVGKLDPRIRLRRCGRPLEAEFPEGARNRGRTTVIVRCPDKGGWSIHVTGIIDVFDQVVVLSRGLARGATVTRDMLEVEERNTARLHHGYFRKPEEVTGRIARRTLAPGAVLTPASVAAPLLVRRGERVTLVASHGAVSVRMQGKALRDGSLGDRIPVRNVRSKRVVEGEVVSRGVVKMTF